MRVGLDEFFKFDTFSLDIIERHKNNAAMYELRTTSWMAECAQGKDYVLNKYRRLVADKYPQLTTVLEDELLSNTTWHPDGQDTWAQNSLRRASVRLMELHERIKDQLPSFNYFPADLARDFINMVCRFKDPHPHMLCAEWVWAQFNKYLVDMELISTAAEAHHDVKTAASA
jgi:hypothetical protein